VPTPRSTVPLSLIEQVLGVTLPVAEARYAQLTPRERQVAERMAAGEANAAIAAALRISPRTLAIHRGNVMAKLEASTAAAVANLVNVLRLAQALEGEP
jgi:FixJ family two-component response regulator